MEIDRHGMAQFLRQRREALQPEDVGLGRGPRRRASGLRREEVAMLSHMSADYYSRLERGDGPHPSAAMIASIAQALHLSVAERDHLLRLAGHEPPARGSSTEFHISPGLLRVLDRLHDTPAEIVSEIGETLRQTPLGVALTGDTTSLTGHMRSLGYRWFTDPSSRAIYDESEHDFLSRLWASGLREVVTLRGPQSVAARMADALLEHSDEFAELWRRHEVGLRPRDVKRFQHPHLGLLELTCQTLIDPTQSHYLLVYTAEPGSESYEKLRLLSVLGSQSGFDPAQNERVDS